MTKNVKVDEPTKLSDVLEQQDVVGQSKTSKDLWARWLEMVETRLKDGKYKPIPELNVVTKIHQNDTLDDAKILIAKIMQNWDSIKKVADWYDELLDFSQKYQGNDDNLKKLCREKIFEYSKFLKDKLAYHAPGVKIFDRYDRFSYGIGESIYMSEFKREFETYKLLKKGKKPKKKLNPWE